MLAGAALIAVALGLSYRRAAPAGGGLPKRVGDLALSGPVQSGPGAISQISGLHGTSIAIKNAYIGQYAGPSGRAMLWVSESSSEEDARALLEAMDRKMPGNDAFGNRVQTSVAGQAVFRVEGGGMINYYYRLGTRVFWVGYAGSGDGAEVLSRFIAAFSDR